MKRLTMRFAQGVAVLVATTACLVGALQPVAADDDVVTLKCQVQSLGSGKKPYEVRVRLDLKQMKYTTTDTSEPDKLYTIARITKDGWVVLWDASLSSPNKSHVTEDTGRIHPKLGKYSTYYSSPYRGQSSTGGDCEIVK